jgi:hypothetical protein
MAAGMCRAGLRSQNGEDVKYITHALIDGQ